MNDIDQKTLDKVARRERLRRYYKHVITLLSVEGYTAQKTAEYLNEMRYKTVRGLPYTASNVARILSKEAPADGKD